MQKHTQLSLLAGILIAVTGLLPSCTIEKRHFSNGYSVQWKKHFKTGNENEETNRELAQTTTEDEQELRTAVSQTEESANAIEETSGSVSEELHLDIPTSDEQFTPSQPVKEEIRLQEKKTKTVKQEQPKKERSNVKKGIFMLIYALIFALLGLAFGGLGALGAAFAFIFYLVAGVAALFGIIYIIIGLAKGN